MIKTRFPRILFFMAVIFFLAGPAPSMAAKKWRILYLASDPHGNIYATTSELKDPGPREYGPYGGHNLFDKNPATCWAEGTSGSGIGEAVHVEVPEDSEYIHIFNGYGKSKKLFKQNNRVKTLKISVMFGIFRPDRTSEIFNSYDVMDYGQTMTIKLADEMKPQKIKIPYLWKNLKAFKKEALKKRKKKLVEGISKDMDESYILRLEIADVYKGSKYHDTCISEIWFSE